jgi:hypothetical protein
MFCTFWRNSDLFLEYLKRDFILNVVYYASLNDRVGVCDYLEIMCTAADMAFVKVQCISNFLEQSEESLIISWVSQFLNETLNRDFPNQKC